MITMQSKVIVGGIRRQPRALRGVAPWLGCLLALLWTSPTRAQATRPAYRSPIDLAFAPDRSYLAVADRTWPGLLLLRPDGSLAREIKLLGDPSHVAWNGPGKVWVAEGSNGTVAEIDVASGAVLRRIAVGLAAKGLAITPDGARLLTCDRALNKLVVVKLASGTVESTVPVGREPGAVAVSKDGALAVVGNKLPRPEDPRKGTPAAEISIVELGSGQVTAIPLVKQATMVRQVVLSPDGKWAYVTHQSPRAGLPVTQLDNGWVMANALSVIDLKARALYANFLFDRSGSGAAHPWGAAINGDGSTLWVSLAGVREVATVDLNALQDKLAGYTATQRLELITNLTELHSAGIIKRKRFEEIDGPRGVALTPDGSALAVAAYFTGKVLLLSPADLSLNQTITLPNNPAEDQIRMGERYFHSATSCYQNWLSCSSCHDDGHADGLNWDLQNDGTGNPKQTKSLVHASDTPPSMVSGARETAEVSTRAGYQFIQFQAAPEDRVQATYAFLKSLAPEPSPFLGPDGQLTPDAVEGKKLFEGPAGCAGCHQGPFFTDMKKHDVGTRLAGTDGPDNNPTWDSREYDTPTLIEVWRTAPYLHLGNALTIQEVMTTQNKERSVHGKVADLSAQQIDQVAAYVMQIGPTRDKAIPVPMPDAGAPTPDASSGAGGADAGAPVARDAPVADGPGGASGGSAGTGGSATTDTAGASGSSSNGGWAAGGGPGGQGGAPASSATQPGDASVQGTVTLKRGEASCHLGGSPSSSGGSLLLLLGLAWLLRPTRGRDKGRR